MRGLIHIHCDICDVYWPSTVYMYMSTGSVHVYWQCTFVCPLAMYSVHVHVYWQCTCLLAVYTYMSIGSVHVHVYWPWPHAAVSRALRVEIARDSTDAAMTRLDDSWRYLKIHKGT